MKLINLFKKEKKASASVIEKLSKEKLSKTIGGASAASGAPEAKAGVFVDNGNDPNHLK
jgi:hypothetical protein